MKSSVVPGIRLQRGGRHERRIGRLSIAIVMALSTLVGVDVPAASADATFTPSPWHGRKVYLSPALHSPENVGCDGYQESLGARRIATRVKDYLYARGYAVRIGSGTFQQNVASSNAWRATVHIPIHSNAAAFDCTSPYDFGLGGSWLMYKPGSASGSNLAQKIFDAIKASSPGTWDLKSTDEALSGFALYELRNTKMPAAYVETAFHTFRPDVDWMRLSTTVGNRIGAGIDNYFGNPRCPPCPMSAPLRDDSADASADDGIASTEPATETRRSRTLETSLADLLRGSREESAIGYGGSVTSVETAPGGTAVVDFARLPGLVRASTTSIARALIGDLNAVLFADPRVEAVEYRLSGSCSKFWTALQAPCQRVERGG